MDRIDVNLVKELQKDGRLNNRVLGRRLGIHPTTVSKRIKVLIEEKSIAIRARPNLPAMGYHSTALLLIETHLSHTHAICAALYPFFNISMVITTFDQFNVICRVHFRDWKELLSFMADTVDKLEGVRSIRPYAIRNNSFQGDVGLGVAEQDKLDATDFKIVALMSENGRCSANYLARELDISLSTSVRRMNYLLKHRYITVKALENPSRFGFVSDALILMKVEPDPSLELIRQLAVNDRVYSIYPLFSGEFNLVFGVLEKTPEALFSCVQWVLENIQKFSTPGRMKIFIRGEVKKRYFGGFLM